MNEIISEKLLTKEEVCVFYGISTPTLDRWIRSGKVTPLKIGKAVRFAKDTLELSGSTHLAQKGGLK